MIGAHTTLPSQIQLLDLVSMRGTGQDDISMQFASQYFRPCWIYPWVAVNCSYGHIGFAIRYSQICGGKNIFPKTIL